MRHRVTVSLALATSFAAAACAGSSADTASTDSAAATAAAGQAVADSMGAEARNAAVTSTMSVILERGSCKGGCTPYRLQIGDNGTVSFLMAGDATVHTDQIPAAQAQALLASMSSGGFQSLDTAIVEGTPSCGGYAMDAPVVTLRMQSANDTHSVRHDYGCASLPRLLREWSATADSIANTARWLPTSTGASR